MDEDEARKTAQIVALSASSMEIFPTRHLRIIFSILTALLSRVTQVHNILLTHRSYEVYFAHGDESGKRLQMQSILTAASESEKSLMLELAKFNSAMRGAYEENAPHRICAYIYDLANAFNHFYHETKIMTEEDEKKQAGYIRLLN